MEKKTVGYQRYIYLVDRNARQPGQPSTPRKGQQCSKRSWDGQVRKWRRELHCWDPTDPAELAKWKAIVFEKFGLTEEEEVGSGPSSPYIGGNNSPSPRELESVVRALVF